ncbi:Gmad2 immunoglobulin-like domain-containing protein [Phytoactinopolyspora mesophila]|uniref:GerMN domain-containing protein n=1 Tax=Phytoactinopolyspora mesophila TaxID=2650750 RepID=A0A7K3M124_9ACTN|nr:Gmad2 immunoglobulin-like domain-containing protein [Phytoactinopolyspora mesophila]NDL56737.1 hypothetical protein [Phytoactinopolyspora mesophila]
MNEQWTPEEQRLSAALNSAADNITPGPDGLAQIKRRTAQRSWWRQPALLGVAAGVATAAAAIVVAVNVLGTSEDEPAVMPLDSPTATESSPPATPETTPGPGDPTGEPDEQPTEPGEENGDAQPTAPGDDTPRPEEDGDAEQRIALPVYYTVEDRITREWQRVRTADPLGAAVHQALNGPSLDPRYESLWEPVDVVSAQVTDGVIEIDLRSPVELAADPALADVAVQQLVFTATATAASTLGADGTLPVQILVDGEPPADLFGELDLTEPVGRADETDIRYFVQIDSPGYEAEVSSPVEVTGVAAVFEATVLWELERDGDVIDSGHATTGEAFTFSEFSIDLGELEPGDYEITVMETDPSDGEGRDPFFDTKAFTVTDPTP